MILTICSEFGTKLESRENREFCVPKKPRTQLKSTHINSYKPINRYKHTNGYEKYTFIITHTYIILIIFK